MILALKPPQSDEFEEYTLFVDPVGDAVDDFVELSVLRHLALGVVVEQFHEEEVVVANEGHLTSQ